jgi:hypothetical protein
MGTSPATAVVMPIDSQTAQSEESASPLKPKVVREVREENKLIFDVWALSAEGQN